MIFNIMQTGQNGKHFGLNNEELNDLYCSPNNNMNGAYSVCGGEEWRVQGFDGET
jgi:hypothetical protein